MSQATLHRIDSTDSFASQPRVSSSHGVIRGSTVRLTAGVSRGAIGRLHSTAIPAPPPSSGDASDSRPPSSSRSGGNYFGAVSFPSQQGTSSAAGGETPPGRSTAQAGTSGTGSSSEFAWDQGTFHGRVTLSRGGRRADNVTPPSHPQQQALASSPSIAAGAPSAEIEVAMQRRTSLISSALGRRPSQSLALTSDHRTADLLQKQDSLRFGSRPSDARGTHGSARSLCAAASTAAEGGGGEESSERRQRRASGFDSRTIAAAQGISPRNPLTERRMSSISTAVAARIDHQAPQATAEELSLAINTAQHQREEGIGPMASARYAGDENDKDAAALSKMWCCT